MASTTYTLEGPDLEALLARVPAEHGPDAVIVAANKLRTGGLGGFFAKEAFEVVVDVPDRPGANSTTEPSPAPARPSAPRVSTEAVGFSSVLERMVRDAGVGDEAPRAVGPALRDLAPAPEPAVAPSPSAEHASEAIPEVPEPFEPLLPARVDPAAAGGRRERRTTPAVATAAPVGPSLDQRWLARVGLPPGIAARLTTVSTDPSIELFHLMEQVTRPEPLPTGRGSVIVVVGAQPEALEVCATFAEQLGVNPEGVLVAAASLDGVSVSEDRCLSNIEQAREQRRSWRRRERPTLVALDAAVGRRARTGWANHLLDAVEPTMVWGIVDASRKAEDIREWANRLGGLDALAVTGLDDTVSPATVLGAGVPVGLLDGHEATASRWTAVLAEHLEVAA